MLDDFEDLEELDPIEKIELKEKNEKTMEESMRYAFAFIEKMGIDNWILTKEVPVSPERKKVILERMIQWFVNPDREEYEKALVLKKGLDIIEKYAFTV